MATVSELAFGETGLVDFCACCGLRRPLGRLNIAMGPGQELVRCVDCFFDPSDDRPRFHGEAIYVGPPVRNECAFGSIGDVLRQSFHGPLIFEPHGNFAASFEVEENQLFAFHRYAPKAYSVRSPHDHEHPI